MNNKTRIVTLQSLRCFAFLGVFISHACGTLYLGRWGVSVFFVLSGFLMTYNYFGSKRLNAKNVKDSIIFSFSKIRDLYPLHIITTLFFVFLSFVGENKAQISITSIANIISNFLLIQTWLPFEGFRSITGVSWYLCTFVFTQFMFPFINKYMEKYNKKKAYVILSLSTIILIAIGIMDKILSTFGILSGVLYEHPLHRFWEFFIGCNVGYIFLHRNHNLEKFKYTLLEFVAICLVFISNIANALLIGDEWSTVLVFIFSTIVIIYTFAIGKGRISNLLTNNITSYIAKISQYAFLIHIVVFKCLEIVYYHIPNINIVEFDTKYGSWIKLSLGLILTIVSCEFWLKLINYTPKKR